MEQRLLAAEEVLREHSAAVHGVEPVLARSVIYAELGGGVVG